MSTLNTQLVPTGPPASARAADEPTLVLVVDDSPFDRQLIARLLTQVPNLKVIFAESIQTGMQTIAHESPSIVITDLILPDGEGLEIVKRVREQFPGISVILMTAYGSEDVAMQALRAGAANYIAKRNMTHDLVPTLSRVLEAASSSRERARILRCMVRTESVFVLDNDPDLIAGFMKLVQELLSGVGLWDETGLVQVSIALQEAVSNAVFHGNLEVSSTHRQTDDRIFSELALQQPTNRALSGAPRSHSRAARPRRRARLSVSDDGPGFDVSLLHRPVDPEDLNRIGGRGLLLIRTFMDEVTFNSHGNQIIMIKNRERDRPEPLPPL